MRPGFEAHVAANYYPNGSTYRYGERAHGASTATALSARVQNPQNVLLTINEGDDLELDNCTRVPYELIDNLGHGASAIVEKVRDVNSNRIYARKIIRNYHSRKLDEVKKVFQNELRVIRRLKSHHHIIRVFATYITRRELALILTPVADTGDLAAYLQNYRDTDSSSSAKGVMETILWRAYGCLASGLAFIHQQTVRHKDIKPRNILVHQGNVIYTDFGISFDFSEQGRSTTTGRPDSFTRKYCAPEVADHDNRNSKSDVFSLGCVYAEMLDALQPNLLPEAFFKGSFHQNLNHIFSLGMPKETAHRYILKVIQSMLTPQPGLRISAGSVVSLLSVVQGAMELFCIACAPSREPASIISQAINHDINTKHPTHRLSMFEDPYKQSYSEGTLDVMARVLDFPSLQMATMPNGATSYAPGQVPRPLNDNKRGTDGVPLIAKSEDWESIFNNDFDEALPALDPNDSFESPRDDQENRPKRRDLHDPTSTFAEDVSRLSKDGWMLQHDGPDEETDNSESDEAYPPRLDSHFSQSQKIESPLSMNAPQGPGSPSRFPSISEAYSGDDESDGDSDLDHATDESRRDRVRAYHTPKEQETSQAEDWEQIFQGMVEKMRRATAGDSDIQLTPEELEMYDAFYKPPAPETNHPLGLPRTTAVPRRQKYDPQIGALFAEHQRTLLTLHQASSSIGLEASQTFGTEGLPPPASPATFLSPEERELRARELVNQRRRALETQNQGRGALVAKNEVATRLVRSNPWLI